MLPCLRDPLFPEIAYISFFVRCAVHVSELMGQS